MLDIGHRIESGADNLEALASAIEAGGPLPSDPSSMIAALAFAGLGRDLGPGLLRGVPARPELIEVARETSLASVFPKSRRSGRLALSAGLLQVLDDWVPSHQAAQEADDLGEPEFSAYWHGIAHRREPDPGNAAYWFRRVGTHAAFGPLAEAAESILRANGDAKTAARLVPGGRWDAIAFVAFCGEAARRRGSPEESVARRIQRAEMLILLEMTARPLL